MNKQLDTLIMGHISKDINISYDGNVQKVLGGAVLYSSYAAQAGGNVTGVVTKIAKEDIQGINMFNISQKNIYCIDSSKTTSIRNQYLSEDKEMRKCNVLSIADPFTLEDIPEVNSKIYHFAGLIVGDFDEDMILVLSKRGKVAVDVQGFLRRAEVGQLIFKDWENKKKLLPYIDYFKTDAVEAQILTGLDNRKEAARKLADWGAKEIMITHHTEVLIFNGKDFYTQPLKPRNLSGRTGRGDTCFSSYITERNTKSIEQSLLYAAALVSLKMEKSGPFKGDRKDVEKYIKQFY